MSEKPFVTLSHLKTYFDVTRGAFAPKQIVKAVDEDMDQYFDDIDIGDFVTLYRATDFLREKNT